LHLQIVHIVITQNIDNMKKILVLALVSLMALPLSAENKEKGGDTKWGVTAGMNYSNSSQKIGFDGGGTVFIPLRRHNNFVTASLMYSIYPGDEYYINDNNVKSTLHSVRLPLMFGRKFYVSDSNAITAEVGPHISCGFNAHNGNEESTFEAGLGAGFNIGFDIQDTYWFKIGHRIDSIFPYSIFSLSFTYLF